MPQRSLAIELARIFTTIGVAPGFVERSDMGMFYPTSLGRGADTSSKDLTVTIWRGMFWHRTRRAMRPRVVTVDGGTAADVNATNRGRRAFS